MYPYFLPDVFGYKLPTYDIMIMLGIFAMFIYLANRFDRRDGFPRQHTNLILIILAVSLLFALLSSYVFDGVFHSFEEGELTFGSITFIGGLIGGLVCFWFLMKWFYKYEDKDMRKITNSVITGVVLAHAFGRIGCFAAGCCYGIPTDSFVGVTFPYGHAHETYPNTPVYPTQLFESAFLFVFFILLDKLNAFKNWEFEVYLIGYGIWRFMLEFIRGDDRGSLLPFIHTAYNDFPTPSQYLSLAMIIIGVILLVRRKKKALKPTLEAR